MVYAIVIVVIACVPAITPRIQGRKNVKYDAPFAGALATAALLALIVKHH